MPKAPKAGCDVDGACGVEWDAGDADDSGGGGAAEPHGGLRGLNVLDAVIHANDALCQSAQIERCGHDGGALSGDAWYGGVWCGGG